jgi:hypothetical protein
MLAFTVRYGLPNKIFFGSTCLSFIMTQALSSNLESSSLGQQKHQFIQQIY